MKKVIFIIVLSIIALLTAPFSAAVGSTPSDWAKADVDAAAKLDFIPAELQGDYTKNVTRAEFAKIATYFAAMQYNVDWGDFDGIYSQAHAGYNNKQLPPLSDTDDIYVNCAYRLGIVNGRGNGIFDPDAPITRQEAAKMLMNTYRVYSDALPDTQGTAAAFGDSDEIADWAKSDTQTLLDWNVMQGVGGNRFDPLGYYTREQCLATFMRLYTKAPESQLYGKSLCPVSYDEFVGQIKSQYNNQGGYYLSQELDTPSCSVFYVGVSGTPHGSSNALWIIYKNGGRREIYSHMPKDPNAPPIYSYAMDNLALSEDQKTLTFTVNGYYYLTNGTECSVDLATGKITVIGPS